MPASPGGTPPAPARSQGPGTASSNGAAVDITDALPPPSAEASRGRLERRGQQAQSAVTAARGAHCGRRIPAALTAAGQSAFSGSGGGEAVGIRPYPGFRTRRCSRIGARVGRSRFTCRRFFLCGRERRRVNGRCPSQLTRDQRP